MEIVNGRVVAALSEPLAGNVVSVLGCLTQCEQRFVTPLFGALFRDCKHIIRGEEWLFEPGGRLSEGAVPARISTQHREWDEHLWRVRESRSERRVSFRRCFLKKGVVVLRQDFSSYRTERINCGASLGQRHGNRVHVVTVAILSSESELSGDGKDPRCTFIG